MQKLSCLSLLISSLIGAFGITNAQIVSIQPNSANYSASSEKTMRVAAFWKAIPEDESEPIFYEYQGKKVALGLDHNSLTNSIPIPNGGNLKLYQQTKLPAEGGEEQVSYREVGNVALVKSSMNLVLLIVPKDLTKEQVSGYSFDDSKKTHTLGTARVFNVYSKAISFRIGEEVLELPEGKSGTIPWKAVAFNSLSYEVSKAGKEKGTWKIFQRAESSVRPNTRTFVFISDALPEGEEPAPVNDKEE